MEIADEVEPPRWAKQMQAGITKGFEDMNGSMKIIIDKMSLLETRIGDLEAKEGLNAQEIHLLKSEANTLKEELQFLRKGLASATDEAKKKNILLFGIPETETSDEERLEMVKSHIYDFTGISRNIDRAYRKGVKAEGKQRPIVATYLSICDRDAVLDAAKHYAEPGSRPTIKPDLCLATREGRHQNWLNKQKGSTHPNPQTTSTGQYHPVHLRPPPVRRQSNQQGLSGHSSGTSQRFNWRNPSAQPPRFTHPNTNGGIPNRK